MDVEHLLGRPEVDLLSPGVKERLVGRVVLVTGAGGSIGSSLVFSRSRIGCRAGRGPGSERMRTPRAGHGVGFRGHRSISWSGAWATRFTVARVFDRHAPTLVFHAAAHKYVTLMEKNPEEAYRNNVGGTATLSEAASRTGASTFVLVSSDKAVNPVGIMGMDEAGGRTRDVGSVNQRRHALRLRATGQRLRKPRQRGAEVRRTDRRRRPDDSESPSGVTVLHLHPRSRGSHPLRDRRRPGRWDRDLPSG